MFYIILILSLTYVSAYKEVQNRFKLPTAFPVDCRPNRTFSYGIHGDTEEFKNCHAAIVENTVHEMEQGVMLFPAGEENIDFNSIYNTFYWTEWGQVAICRKVVPLKGWNWVPSPLWYPNMPQMWTFKEKPNAVYREFVKEPMAVNLEHNYDYDIHNVTISDTVILVTGNDDHCEGGASILIPHENVTLTEADDLIRKLNEIVQNNITNI